MHKNISEYYLGTWSESKLKPLFYEHVIMPKINPTDNKVAYDKPIINRIKLQLNRLVPIQPIKYDDYHTHISPRFNLRKLQIMPYHLIQANMINGL